MTVRVVASVVALLIGTSLPSSAKASFYTGNDLLEKCGASKDDATYYQKLASCTGYVMGVFDDNQTLNAALGKRLYCDSSEMTGKQIRDVAVAYLQRHPETRHQSASLLVLQSYIEAFPCPAK